MVTITDHAIVRYIERVRGIDLDAVRREIAEVTRAAVAAGASKISVDGFTYMIRKGAVTTVTVGKSPSSAYRKSERHKGRSTRAKVGRR